MRIGSNALSMSVFMHYERNVQLLQKSLERISSGKRILRAGDDPGGLGIAEKMRMQVTNIGAAKRNIENFISSRQTADGWMQAIDDMLGRMAELAIEANDGTKTSADRINLNLEFSQMKEAIGAIVGTSKPLGTFNSRNLFSTDAVTLQVGPDVGQTYRASFTDLRSNVAANSWASVFDITVTTQTNASVAIGKLSNAKRYLSARRAMIGSQQERMEYTLNGLTEFESNVGQAESRIRNVDIALETTKFTKQQILVQAGTAMLAQANTLMQSALQSLGG